MDMKELIQGGLTNEKRGLDRVLNTLTPVELRWQPKPDANSIQIILFHMAHIEDSIVLQRLQGKPQIWESEAWFEKLKRPQNDHGAHYTLADLTAFHIDVKDLLSYKEAIRAKTAEYINGLQEADFSKKITLAPFGPPPPGGGARPPMEIAVGSMLLMMLTHLAQHVGEISYIRGLQRGMDK